MAKTIAPAESMDQLGLDFEGERPSPANVGVAKEESTPELHWSAPNPVKRGSGGMGALARACASKDAKLAIELLSLPIDWSINERIDFPPKGEKTEPNHDGANAALGHLLAGHAYQPGHWNQPTTQEHELTTQAALALVGRGADFLAMDRQGICPLTQCAQSHRSAFIEALQGHPDFVHAKLKNLRVGAAPHDSSCPDARLYLLGKVIRSGETQAAKALITGAGFPINEMDGQGMLPIGHCVEFEMLQALIELGADCSLQDKHGLNAMARAQETSDTATREKMIGRIANELKRGAKKDPSLMASLQSQNIAALLEAAQNAPKSSLLKTISAFKFDAASIKDPKTLTTPLMAALRGGRMASAEHLILAGCNLNDANIDGVSAAAYLLANYGTPNGPSPTELAKRHGSKIDFELRSKRGFPTALEAVRWMAKRLAASYGHGHQVNGALDAAMAARLSQGAPALEPHCFLAHDGTTLVEAYSCEGHGGHSWHGDILALTDMSLRMGLPESIDGAVAAVLNLASGPQEFSSNYGNGSRALTGLQSRCPSLEKSGPFTRSALALSKKPALGAALAKAHPALHAAIEATDLLESLAVDARPAARAARL